MIYVEHSSKWKGRGENFTENFIEHVEKLCVFVWNVFRCVYCVHESQVGAIKKLPEFPSTCIL